MRNVLITTALLATLSTACTHHYTVRMGERLPENETHRAMGALAGAGVGALVGGVGGYAYGYSGGDEPPCRENDWVCGGPTAEQKGQIVGVFGAVTGALAGAVIGGAIGFKDEYRYENPAVPMVTAVVTPDRAGAAASWRF